jgi:hypothetical protein
VGTVKIIDLGLAKGVEEPQSVAAARWAQALLGEAMNRLRQAYATRQKIATVEVLEPSLDLGSSKDPPSYEQAAAALQVSLGRYTALVREEVNRTVSAPCNVSAEIRELCEALTFAEGWIVP